MSATFGPGDLCLLLDPRGRRYLIEIRPGQTFQYHGGWLRHDTLVGVAPGTVVRSSAGGRIAALRPRLADYILTMKRGAQVVYPKDIGPILHWGDIGAGDDGARGRDGVGGADHGPGAGGGAQGRVVSVEERPDHAAGARRPVRRFLGEIPANLAFGGAGWKTSSRRWARTAWCSTSPSRGRWWARRRRAWPTGDPLRLPADGAPGAAPPRRAAPLAPLHGPWTPSRSCSANGWPRAGSVRPASQMVGHTGFITVARNASGR